MLSDCGFAFIELISLARPTLFSPHEPLHCSSTAVFGIPIRITTWGWRLSELYFLHSGAWETGRK
jgi:hypothetical protein